MQLIVRPEAEQDLAEASDWYKHQNLASREMFISKVESLFERITQHPHQFPHSHENVRRARVSGFPYSIYFKVEDRRVIALAVLHHRRDFSTLDERLN